MDNVTTTRATLWSPESTLIEKEVGDIIEKIIKALEANNWEVRK